MATTSKKQAGPIPVVDLYQFEGTDAYQEGDERARVRGQFALTPGMPNGTDAGAEELMMVCIEIEPGDNLPSHRDSNEELLVVIEGTVAATVGDETVTLETGQAAVVPEMAPHGLENAGDGTARVLGIFSGTELTATFEGPMEPFGTAELTIGPMPTDEESAD